MTVGAVKWFDPQRGFGWVTSDGGGDVFLHAQELSRGGVDPKGVQAGQRISFEIVVRGGRTRAADIAVIE